VLDTRGDVAEAGTSNPFLAEAGVGKTPARNGTVLAGITGRRTIELLRRAGIQGKEITLKVADFMEAAEILAPGKNSGGGGDQTHREP
jgi:branched-chain amino acid aminotransferase